MELQNSHILPKWTYRRAFDDSRANGLPNPVVVEGDTAIQTSRENKEPMLCRDCEQRLSPDENYVSRIAYQDDGSLGLTRMMTSTPMLKLQLPDGRGHFRAAKIESLDGPAIARFAASVFWRAHVATRQKVDSLKLWNPQAEALRLFIRGEAPLPPRSCFSLVVTVDGEQLTSVHSTTSSVPASGRRGHDGFHQFIAAGLLFNLSLGNVALPEICLVCSPVPHVIFQDWRQIRLATEMTAMFLTAERKGHLGRVAVKPV
ncbi:MAG TPA: hypothetical protein VGL59_23230 [Polyangia bacterium]